jgi:MFS family permease
MERNIPLFLAFRTLFNGRFYYPIFAILFLDYGLTLEQFGILNAIWAVTIIALEVPSGALADVLGRRKLVILAGALMVAEMALLVLVPIGDSTLVFWVFVANRILSGAAEAMASGADEALAYDSLPEGRQEELWPRIMERVMRWQNGGFVVASLLGAAVFDQAFMNSALNFLGAGFEMSKDLCTRMPLILNTFTALGALGVAIAMREQRTPEQRPNAAQLGPICANAFSRTWAAGKWILATPMALSIILLALFLDSAIRVFLTINSQYYRIIELPEASFGLIGTALAVVGLFIPTLARKLQQGKAPIWNFSAVAVVILFSLVGAAFVIPYVGVLFAATLMVGMLMLSFFVSNYLNAITEPGRRATVLSFRGLSLNVAYGLMTLAFGIIVKYISQDVRAEHGNWDDTQVQNEAVSQFLAGYPVYFAIAAVVVFIATRKIMGARFHEEMGKVRQPKPTQKTPPPGEG